jgi:hypothetical protein
MDPTKPGVLCFPCYNLSVESCDTAAGDLPSMADANRMINITQSKLEQLVGEN